MNQYFITVVLITAVISGCTLKRHTIPPYKKDPELSYQLQKKAITVCEERKKEIPVRPMFTDGCSAWPDGKKRECCVEHDISYWCGGTRQDRLKADRLFRSCVKEKTNAFDAFVLYRGVRFGGKPYLPFRWRWGYGYKYLEKHRYDKKQSE